MGRKSKRISSKLIVWIIEEHGDVQLDPTDVAESTEFLDRTENKDK